MRCGLGAREGKRNATAPRAHEEHAGVKHAALYGHFLDGVWIVIFATVLVLG